MPSPLLVDAAPALLRVLHVEDSELDHELLLAELRAGGLQIECERVETRAAFVDALSRPWQAVICDHNLPDASGLELLALLRERDAVLPFLLVSG